MISHIVKGGYKPTAWVKPLGDREFLILGVTLWWFNFNIANWKIVLLTMIYDDLPIKNCDLMIVSSSQTAK